MSGGVLTDYQYNLGELLSWADGVERDNPLLADQLRDIHTLLGRYDYYLSGDIGEDGIQKAWSEYRKKWLDIDTEHVEKVLFEKCLDLVHSTIKGHGNYREW